MDKWAGFTLDEIRAKAELFRSKLWKQTAERMPMVTRSRILISNKLYVEYFCINEWDVAIKFETNFISASGIRCYFFLMSFFFAV